MRKFFGELRRRNVVRVGLAYVVVGWLVAQIGETVLPAFDTPAWVLRTLIVLIVLGLPFALLFAWAFELTPDGIKKTREVDLSASLTHSTGRKLNLVIIGALVVALGYFIWERQGLIEASRQVAAAPAAGEPAAGDETTDDATTASPRSIAVLPFVNLSADPAQAWFADGLTEELLNSLVRTPDLLVASRTSSFGYKDTTKPLPQIAEELGVDHVLEGSVRRSGDRLRITAQLIRAGDGFHLWSETYDRTLDDVIELQEEIAIEIARALETAMDPEALAAMMAAGTRSVPAYEAYLRGLAHDVSIQAEGDIYEALGAREAFEQAVKIDPEFAEAWAELGIFWNIQLNSALIVSGVTGLSERQMLEQQQQAFDRAIAAEKDPTSILRYQALRAAPSLDLQHRLRVLENYLARRPNDVDAKIDYLFTLEDTRQFDKALDVAIDFVSDGNPDPILHTLVLQTARYAGDDTQRRELVQRVLTRFPGAANLQYQSHRTLLYAADVDGASRLLPAIENSVMPQSTKFLARLRQACAEGRSADARQLAERYRATREVPLEEERSIEWLSLQILGDREAAHAVLAPLDNEAGIGELADFLGYGHFDARDYPYLASRLAGEDVAVGDIRDIPYRCPAT